MRRSFVQMFDEKQNGNFELNTNFKYEISVLKNLAEKKVIINSKRELFELPNAKNYLIDLLEKELKNTFKLQKSKKILVVGLGNSDVQTDSLGPMVAKKIVVSRGLKLRPEVSAFFPNVFSNTGIETSEIVRAICQIVKPNVVILVDSFSTNSVARICQSFQLFEGGISAGSGLGSRNKQMTKEYLNVEKVVSVGVPLLICERGLISKIADQKNLEIDSSLILSPINIKKEVEIISKIIATAINKTLFQSLSKEEIETLVQ